MEEVYEATRSTELVMIMSAPTGKIGVRPARITPPCLDARTSRG